MVSLKQLLVLSFIAICICSKNVHAQIMPTVLVHGGAGDVPDESLPERKYGVKMAARAGYEALKRSENVLDAVQEAVQFLELYEWFNAGHGSVLTWDGTVEMDAAIMEGVTLNAGCVSVARDISHPIDLARRIMEKTRHKYLAGEGAMNFAIEQGFELLPHGALITERARKALEDYKNSLNSSALENRLYGSPGTVGAVAIDAQGNVAAATSTGGITGKLPGRIGDSPILGGGTYADNAAGAISATGQGETIMRYNVASRILALIEFQNKNALDATREVLQAMTARFNQTAGVISIDSHGGLGIYFTSQRMLWSYQRGDELHFGADKDEDEMEIVGQPRVAAGK